MVRRVMLRWQICCVVVGREQRVESTVDESLAVVERRGKLLWKVWWKITPDEINYKWVTQFKRREVKISESIAIYVAPCWIAIPSTARHRSKHFVCFDLQLNLTYVRPSLTSRDVTAAPVSMPSHNHLLPLLWIRTKSKTERKKERKIVSQ